MRPDYYLEFPVAEECPEELRVCVVQSVDLDFGGRSLKEEKSHRF